MRFAAAYPITPATEVLEWLAPALTKVGGALLQAEDELAAINMIIGASFGGTPSLTATSGPGLSLMIEALGLATSAEIPLVVVDVMRGGPSTGIPTKSEQGDLNVAIYGLHGDAPHLVLAPQSVTDCLFTTQWATYLAETLQCPAIVLSDQFIGQARAAVERPADVAFIGQRTVATDISGIYKRYALTANGVSPMAIPGTAGGQYTADGLTHTERGTPTSGAEVPSRATRQAARQDRGLQLRRPLGDGRRRRRDRAAHLGLAHRRRARGRSADDKSMRLVAPRLLAPVQPERLAARARRRQAHPGGRADSRRPVPQIPARPLRPAGAGQSLQPAGTAADHGRGNPTCAQRVEMSMSTAEKRAVYKQADYKSDVKPIWCPGCGDYHVLMSFTRAFAQLGLVPEETVVVSGIGCSSRIPAYTNCYGFHGVHGRSLALAAGLKVTRPDLTVVVASGDGDGYSIGGNHFLHACRRNVDMTYVVMDNHIYGMTKGQPSPTTEPEFDTALSPGGTRVRPFHPLVVALASGANFIARCFSGNPNETADVLAEAIRHPGFSFIEILSPCVTFRPDEKEWKQLVHRRAGRRRPAIRARRRAD